MYQIRRCVYELFLIELLSIKYWCVSILTLTFIRLACQRKSKINEALFFFASQNWNIALSSVFSCFPIPVLCLCWNNNIVCLMLIHSWVCNGLRKDNIQVFYDIGFIIRAISLSHISFRNNYFINHILFRGCSRISTLHLSCSCCMFSATFYTNTPVAEAHHKELAEEILTSRYVYWQKIICVLFSKIQYQTHYLISCYFCYSKKKVFFVFI